MAMSVKDLKAWIETLGDDSTVAIDDGGLTLLELGPDGEETGAYMEVGGTPMDEDLDDEPSDEPSRGP